MPVAAWWAFVVSAPQILLCPKQICFKHIIQKILLPCKCLLVVGYSIKLQASPPGDSSWLQPCCKNFIVSLFKTSWLIATRAWLLSAEMVNRNVVPSFGLRPGRAHPVIVAACPQLGGGRCLLKPLNKITFFMLTIFLHGSWFYLFGRYGKANISHVSLSELTSDSMVFLFRNLRFCFYLSLCYACKGLLL